MHHRISILTQFCRLCQLVVQVKGKPDPASRGIGGLNRERNPWIFGGGGLDQLVLAIGVHVAAQGEPSVMGSILKSQPPPPCWRREGAL